MKGKRATVPLLTLALTLLLSITSALAQPEGQELTLSIDRNQISNGGTIRVSGQAPAGEAVYLEVWAEEQVRANRFDNRRDPKTGKIPYVFYLTHEMPAYYKIFIPKEMAGKLAEVKSDGAAWSVSKALKETGAGVAYQVPGSIAIERYQATIMASIIGSRGNLMEAMAAEENRSRSMQLIKARFRSLDKIMGAEVVIEPDGRFSAEIKIRDGLAPGAYNIAAVTGQGVRSAPQPFNNQISFPVMYMGSAGTSLNIIWPFLLTLGVAIFGVLMGAGGGFILNPLLVSIFPLPHTIVAGTVMPTVLFSQGSGIYNYSKIKFINWKLGIGVGLAMLAGGFIGPKLTELITLDQFKFAFGWILLVLAALMLWQTSKGYLEKNKKEQAILKEFKRRAEECAKAGKEVKECVREEK